MKRETFIHAALSFLNIPYIWGGDDFSGLDCSGLAQELLAILGLDPQGDQTAHALYLHFQKSGIEGVIETGSLVFYGTKEKVTHVGLILDGDIMIEAGGGGSRTTDAKAAAQQNAFVRLRPFSRRKDLVAIIQPKGLPWVSGSVKLS